MKKKSTIFKKRFKRLNERISVARYPRQVEENNGLYYFPDMDEIIAKMHNKLSQNY